MLPPVPGTGERLGRWPTRHSPGDPQEVPLESGSVLADLAVSWVSGKRFKRGLARAELQASLECLLGA